MKKSILLTAFLGICISASFAQNDVDALRYSQTPNLGTTARSIGLGGAIGALGADPSAVLTNPAGLAQHKGDAFSISAGTQTLRNRSNFGDGVTRSNNAFKAEIPNLSIVWTDRKMDRGNPRKTGWVNTNIQVGYNKVADYDRVMSFTRDKAQSSLTDYIANSLSGANAANLEANDEQLDQGFYYFENMFWHSYLIDSVTNGEYYAYYDPAAGGIGQDGQIVKKGRMNEFNFAFAANYEHKVYFGATINVNSVNYEERSMFSEEDNDLTLGNWDYYEFTRNLKTTGYGFNGRLGVLFRPNDNIRVGGTIHTPTKFMLSDNYSDELYVLQDDGHVDDLRTVDKEFSYSVTTPAKYGVQAAYIFGKNGFVSGEVVALDYSLMSISSDDDLFLGTNEVIVNKYRNTMNLKLGGEYAINSFRMRGGFASIGNPLQTSGDFSRKILSGGFGFHEHNWAFDIGLSKDLTTDTYVPYTIAGVAPASVSSQVTGTRLMLTITNKF